MSATPTAWSPSPIRRAQRRITAPARRLTTFKPGGHWTRSLLPSPDGTKLYIGVGSLTNIGETAWTSRKAGPPSTNSMSPAAKAASSPTACATRWALLGSRTTGVLWTVVNERDGIGDETPPDYLTSVRDGGFYGWPYCYWGTDRGRPRAPGSRPRSQRAITPDYALGGHTASLGLCWLPAGTLPGFPDGMAIGQHGSWNRSKLSGYKVVFVPFTNGRPVRTATRYPVGLPRTG